MTQFCSTVFSQRYRIQGDSSLKAMQNSTPCFAAAKRAVQPQAKPGGFADIASTCVYSLSAAQSFQRARSLVCIRVPVKAKVSHKLPADDGPGNTPQVHSCIGNG
jgi:hypothetical protein